MIWTFLNSMRVRMLHMGIRTAVINRITHLCDIIYKERES